MRPRPRFRPKHDLRDEKLKLAERLAAAAIPPSSGGILWPSRALSEPAGQKPASGGASEPLFERDACGQSGGLTAPRVWRTPRWLAGGQAVPAAPEPGDLRPGRPQDVAEASQKRTDSRHPPDRNASTRPRTRNEKGRDTAPGLSTHPKKPYLNCPWQCLYFLPLPHGQGSLRPTRGTAPAGVAAFWPGAGVSSRPRSSPRSAAS